MLLKTWFYTFIAFDFFRGFRIVFLLLFCLCFCLQVIYNIRLPRNAPSSTILGYGMAGRSEHCNPTLYSMVNLSFNLMICFPAHSPFYAPGLGSSLEFCYIAQASLYYCIPAYVFWAAVTYLFLICQQSFIFSSHLLEIYWNLFQE